MMFMINHFDFYILYKKKIMNNLKEKKKIL